MKLFSLFLTFTLAGVCLAAGQEPASKPQDKEPSFQGKTPSEWMSLAKDKDPKLRIGAIRALGMIGPEAKTAVPALTELLKDKEARVRMASAEALVKIGPEAKAAIPVVTELLKDKDSDVRSWAAEVLGEMMSEAKGAIPALTELSRDEDRFDCFAATYAILGLQETTGVQVGSKVVVTGGYNPPPPFPTLATS